MGNPCAACPLCTDAAAAADLDGAPPPTMANRFTYNPFANPGGWWVDPSFRSNVKSTIGRASPTPDEMEKLSMMMDVPTAVWLSTSAHVTGNVKGSEYSLLETVLMDAASQNLPPMLVLIFYNLPNRDCNAKASAGEIICKVGPNPNPNDPTTPCHPLPPPTTPYDTLPPRTRP